MTAQNKPPFVPAEAGTQSSEALDSRFRGNERGMWRRPGIKS